MSPMLLAIVVLLNGAFAPSSPPARTIGGHVMVPLGAAVARLADRVTRTAEAIEVARGARVCVFRIGVPAYRCDAEIRLGDAAPVVRDATVYLPLATLVRAFGGTATYDGAHGTVAVTMPPAAELATPAPFDPEAPQAPPAAVFTPQPGPATPRVMESGDPRPRRTAIPATPSRVPL